MTLNSLQTFPIPTHHTPRQNKCSQCLSSNHGRCILAPRAAALGSEAELQKELASDISGAFKGQGQDKKRKGNEGGAAKVDAMTAWQEDGGADKGTSAASSKKAFNMKAYFGKKEE